MARKEKFKGRVSYSQNGWNSCWRGEAHLITGAGANIGRAIALEMAAQGAHIFFADKNAERVRHLEEELRANNFPARGFVCDVARPENLDGVMAQLDAQGTLIDVLVNNAGTTPAPLADTSPATFAAWQNVMDVNVLAPLYLSRLVASRLIEAKGAGNVLFISSIHERVFHGVEVYSASKAALSRLIDELAVPLAAHGIRVNGIAPGSCCEAEDGSPLPYGGAPLYHQSVRPCFIGRAAVFLASDYFSHHTTGTTLTIDGGLSLYAFHSRPLIEPDAAPLLPSWRRGASKVRRWAADLRRETEPSP